jgi:hypothetical protein
MSEEQGGPEEQQRADGDPVNPERMWIGFGLLAVSVVIVILGYSDEETAETVGAGFAPLVIGLLGAMIIRLIWAKGKAAKAFELSGLILCAGIVAVVIAALGVAGKESEENDAQETQDALEQLDLQEY